MIHHIHNNTIINSWQNYPKVVEMPDGSRLHAQYELKRQGVEYLESQGLYREQRQSVELGENEYIAGYSLEVIDGRPVEVPQVATYTEAEMAERLQAWRDNAQVSALDGLLVLDQYSMAAAYQAWTTDPARTFTERAFIDKAQTWKRMDAVLITAATAMGLTETQLDDLFRAAEAI